MRRTIGSARGDARGEAPCMKRTLIPPLPAGKGDGGMGERKQAKGKVGRRQRRQATPSGTTAAGIASAAGVQPPGTCTAGTISAVGGSVQGCRGRSPRRNKLWDSPFPPGRGAGGWGKEIKPKARLAGDKEGTPPLWTLPTPADPATCRANHPLGAANTHRPGDLPGKLPIGHHSGWDSQCRRDKPPHRAPQRQG